MVIGKHGEWQYQCEPSPPPPAKLQLAELRGSTSWVTQDRWTSYFIITQKRSAACFLEMGYGDRIGQDRVGGSVQRDLYSADRMWELVRKPKISGFTKFKIEVNHSFSNFSLTYLLPTIIKGWGYCSSNGCVCGCECVYVCVRASVVSVC